MSDEAEIRALIERWARAVHGSDLGGVLADHAEDIVMFDVPPPKDGVRGIEAYRETWPPFFEWQKKGASFEIVSSRSSPAAMWRTPTHFSAAGPKRSCGKIPPTGSADDRPAQARRPLAGGPRASFVSTGALFRVGSSRRSSRLAIRSSTRWPIWPRRA